MKTIKGLDIEKLAKGVRLSVINELITELQIMKISIKCPLCIHIKNENN